MIRIIILALILTGCSTTTPLPTPNWVPWELTNRASLPFQCEGKRFNGSGVLARKSPQTITFTLPKDTAKFMINSCNREEFFGYPDSSKPFNWIYVPIPFIESTDSCLVIATAITKQGEMYKAVIDFVSEESIPATLRCNGVSEPVSGVALCQSRAGLLQAIEFKEEVVGVSQEGCPELEPYFFEFGFRFKTLPGFCAYRFLNQRKEVFRLTTYGYQSIDEVKVVEPKNNPGNSNPGDSGWGGK